MQKDFFKNPYYRFSFIAIILYILWYLVYELWLHPSGYYDAIIVNNLVLLSQFSLNALGFETFSYGDPINVIGIDGTPGVLIGDACNGFSLFALFLIFMLTYPGPIKHKLWFIPIGLIIIHLVNVIRITTLATFFKISRRAVEINHDYTFTIIVYGIVFLLWWIWAKKFASPSLNLKNNVAE